MANIKNGENIWWKCGDLGVQEAIEFYGGIRQAAEAAIDFVDGTADEIADVVEYLESALKSELEDTEMKFFTDDEMEIKEKLYCIICIGGLTEGFDYSEAKALMHYWASKRRENGYRGGYVKEITAAEAKEMMKNE